MVVVYNPIAGHGKSARAWAAIRPVLDARLGPGGYAVWETQAKGQGEALGRRAAEEGYDLVAALGGDGTISEVANGLLQVAPEKRCVLGVLPGGTGNDFARTLGIPRTPVEAAHALLDGETRLLDAGRVNRRYFVNVSGVGFDAEVAREANAIARRVGGIASYIAAILKELCTFSLAPVKLTIDGQTTHRNVLLVAVGNARFCGGGLMLCPAADPGDGSFDVILGEDLTKLETLLLLPRLFNGSHIRHPKVRSYRATKVTVEPSRALSIQSDGEIIGTAPVTFELIPKALKVAGCRPAPAAESSKWTPGGSR